MRSLIACLCALLLLTACSADLPVRGRQVTPPAETSTPAGDSITLVAAGDVLIHPELTTQATQDGDGRRDYRALLAGVKPVISKADLAICHLETPIAAPAGPFRGYPEFNVPPEIAPALRDLGYDDCSTASNHTLDMGEPGVDRTLDTLDAMGVKHTGSARSAKEAATPLILDVRGVRIAHLSYTFGFNGKTLPPGEPWLANQIDPDAILAAARAARKAGAQLVVVSLHWGTEYVAEPTAEQRRIAQKLLGDPAVDLIIGHHAHVVQPFEKINGKWVVYGMGNQIARHSDPRGTTEEGVIARFRFVRSGATWVVDKAEYVPTLIDLGPPVRLLDLSVPGVDAARREEALRRIDRVVLSRGAPGLTRP